MITTLISFLAGMVLGQRFRVMVLIPASAAAILGAYLGTLLGPTASWSRVAIVISSWCFLQMGYFIGMALRPILAGSLRHSVPSRPLGRSAANERTAL